MPSFSNISIACPEHAVGAEDMPRIASHWLNNEPDIRSRFLRIAAGSGVSTRRFALPSNEILSLNGLQNRAALFERHGTELLSLAVSEAVSQARTDLSEIGAFVLSSCSLPVIPAIDAAVIQRLGLPDDLMRIPIYQQGCAGGVVGLALGSRLAERGKSVIAASVELCSLVFQPRNHSGAQLVGAAIFADGAAATVISPTRGMVRIVDAGSHLLPESRHLMGYDIFDDGFHLRLDRSLPQCLTKSAPAIIADFLKRNGLTVGDIGRWLFHPGGIKILNFLMDALSITKDKCRWSFEVLRDYGNLSSATIYYVLDRFMRDAPLEHGEHSLVLGIGPGLTVELILLRG